MQAGPAERQQPTAQHVRAVLRCADHLPSAACMAGPIIDPGYHEVCFFWFGFALLM